MKVREIPFRDLEQEQHFEITPFTNSESAKWDEFVWTTNNGTLFHTREFLNYHPRGRFQDASLIFKKAGKWVAALSAIRRQERDEVKLISHAGASFGGPVTDFSLSFKDTFRLVEALLDHARANHFNQIVMTLPPQIYYDRPSNYLDFALLDFGFTYLKREVSSVIPLDFVEEDTLLIFSPESRRAVRKAMKSGVEIRESDDFGAFYSVLQNNLKLRHNVRPTHSLDELLLLKKIFSQRIRLFAAFVKERMTGGVVVFVCNPKVALAFYISHDEEMQQYRAVNLLFCEVIRWSIRQHMKFLDFGIFTVNMKPNWGLARFKESFGAQGVFRDTLVKQIVY